MQQLFFNLYDGTETIDLPQLEVGPISHSLGQIRHVIRGAERVVVEQITNIYCSPRVQEPLYRLSNGEHIIVTERRRLSRPKEAEGVLQSLGDGTYKWITHKLVETFLQDVAERGWPALASDIASGWDGKFIFKAERPNHEGLLDSGNEGLRPPQLGALHAIGAHWSIYNQPATIVMPTGTGKTETMLAALAAYIRGPLLVVVPWDLLRNQTARKFLTFGLLRRLGVLARSEERRVGEECRYRW